MIRRIWVVLAMAGILSACNFETRAVPRNCLANDGLGPCGVGETCLAEDNTVQCHCGETLVEGGPVCGDQQSCADNSYCNTPPVAQIGDGSGVVEVGADSEVVLSSHGSHDPDGNPLAFSWMIDGACVLAPATSAEPDLRVAVLGPGTKCSVNLTVDDGWAATTVDAEVLAVDVGTYVWRSDPGCKTVVNDGFTNNGLPSTPWCTIADGLATAVQYGLTEVRVAADDYDEPGLVIPANVLLVGGFQPANAWLRGSISRLLLGDVGARQVDARGVLLAGAGAGLNDFSVDRVDACSGDCALVTVRGTSAIIEGCFIGTGFGTGFHTSAPDSKYVGIDVAAEAEFTYVEIRSTSVGLASEAAEAIGIRLDGRRSGLSGLLQGVNVTSPTGTPSGGGPERVVGIWSRHTTDFSMENVFGSVSSSVGTTVVGFMDGAASSVLPDACSGASFCDGSTGLSVQGFNFTAQTDEASGTAVSMALLGTEKAFVGAGASGGFGSFGLGSNAPSTAFGLLTVGTDQLSMDGGSVDQAYISASGWGPTAGTPNVIAAWIDGWDGRAVANGPALDLGSTGLDARNVTFRPSGEGAGGVAVAATILVGTDGALLEDVALDPLLYGARPQLVSSLWTIATRDVRVVGANATMTPRYESIATGVATAVLDGIIDSDGTPRPEFGSRHLTIEQSRWTRALGVASPAADGGRAACMLLVGTHGGSWIGNANGVDGNLIDCGDWQDSTADSLAQIWTLAVNEVGILGNRIGPLALPLGGVIRSSQVWYGIRDGDLVAETVDVGYGSRALQVVGNRITAPVDAVANLTTAIQIERGGDSQNGEVWLKSNAIRTNATDIDIGIRIGDAPVEVANNTIFAARCTPGSSACPANGPMHAIPLFVEGHAFDVEVANNILTTGPAQTRTLMIDRQGTVATGSLSLSVDAFAMNLLVPPDDVTLQGFSYLCVAGSGVDVGNSHCYGAAGGGANGGLMSDVLVALEDDFGATFHSLIGDVTFCSDDMHVATQQPVAGAADASYMPGVDIDGEPRTAPHDIGADEVGTTITCP